MEAEDLRCIAGGGAHSRGDHHRSGRADLERPAADRRARAGVHRPRSSGRRLDGWLARHSLGSGDLARSARLLDHRRRRCRARGAAEPHHLRLRGRRAPPQRVQGWHNHRRRPAARRRRLRSSPARGFWRGPGAGQGRHRHRAGSHHSSSCCFNAGSDAPGCRQSRSGRRPRPRSSGPTGDSRRADRHRGWGIEPGGRGRSRRRGPPTARRRGRPRVRQRSARGGRPGGRPGCERSGRAGRKRERRRRPGQRLSRRGPPWRRRSSSSLGRSQRSERSERRRARRGPGRRRPERSERPGRSEQRQCRRSR